MTAQLLLVRHGESTWNAARRLQGQADAPLSELGRGQVSRLAALVAQHQIEHVVTSDLGRARTTAALLGFSSARCDDRWREADVGTWTGEDTDALRAADGAGYQAWRDGRYTPPGGEPWVTMVERVCAAAEELIVEGGRHLVVTHGGPIRAVCAGLVRLEPSRVVPVSPATITIIDVNGAPRLQAYNLTAGPWDDDPPD